MSEELKPCPFCKSDAQEVDMLIDDEISHHRGVACSNKDCNMNQAFYLHEWQSRPIEDALRAKLEMAKEWGENMLKWDFTYSGWTEQIKLFLQKLEES